MGASDRLGFEAVKAVSHFVIRNIFSVYLHMYYKQGGWVNMASMPITVYMPLCWSILNQRRSLMSSVRCNFLFNFYLCIIIKTNNKSSQTFGFGLIHHFALNICNRCKAARVFTEFALGCETSTITALWKQPLLWLIVLTSDAISSDLPSLQFSALKAHSRA